MPGAQQRDSQSGQLGALDELGVLAGVEHELEGLVGRAAREPAAGRPTGSHGSSRDPVRERKQR